jgi:hypothetical protein
METCYYYEEVPLKHNNVYITDVAIVLMMDTASSKDNLEHIIQNVPTKRLIIQYNKGFNKCEKKHLIEQKSNYDLCDALKTALEYAFNTLELDNVLVLEDDAYFVSGMEQHLKKVKQFIKNEIFTIYSLGTFGFVGNPLRTTMDTHIKIKTYTGNHAVVYNKSLKFFDLNKCFHTDLYSWHFQNVFMYYKPLVLQHLQVNSSNYNSWPIIGKMLLFIAHNGFGLFKQYPPRMEDYTFIYTFFRGIHLLILFLILVKIIKH